MSAPEPVRFVWEGDVMRPRAPRLADRLFVIGQEYLLAEVQDRSLNTHNHYFAALAECWKSLPEDQAERFASVEHLRKWALIKAGYRDERTVVCGSKAEAARVAAFIKPMDEYAVVSVSGAAVVVLTAKSQSVRAMGKQDFQASKEAVLNVLSELLGVEVGSLPKSEAA